MMHNKNSKIITLTTFLIMGCAFYLITTTNPLRCDDLIYQYFWLSERNPNLREPIDLSQKISSFYDAFISQINHYKVMNGRFLVHYIVQCFCGFIGKPTFNVYNSLVYILFLIGCTIFLKANNITKLITAIATLWLLLPIQHIFNYSIAFSINYLWTSTIIIFFIILLKNLVKTKSGISTYKYVVIFCISIVTGFTHEGFTIPLSCSLFFYLIYTKGNINYKILICSAGLWIGTAVIVFAPGTLSRGVSSIGDSGFHEIMYQKLEVIKYSKRFYIFFACLFLTYIKYKDYTIHFFKKHFVEVSFIIIDFMFVLALPHYSQRVEFPLEWMSVLLTISLLFNSPIWNQWGKRICVFLILIMTIHVPFTVYYAQKVGNEYKCMIQEYQTSPDGITHYQDFTVPKIFSPYIKRLDQSVECDYISFVMSKQIKIEE